VSVHIFTDLKKANFSHFSYVFPAEELFKLELDLDQPVIFCLFLCWLVGWLVGSPTLQRLEINFVICECTYLDAFKISRTQLNPPH
jgi:hypothetical protein